MNSPEVLVAHRVAVEVDGARMLAESSLSIAAGECVAIRGPNGAGKTTLLRVLAGRLRPSAGSVELRGAPLDERRPAVRREIAALIETPTLYPDLTLQDQLALIEAAWSGERSRSADCTAWAGFGQASLDRFGIAMLGERFPHELSSGQRQLVSLAVTFARPCSLLLLDEPEQRLDPDRRGLVAAAILAAQAQGVSVVFSSHDAQLVQRVAQRECVVGV